MSQTLMLLEHLKRGKVVTPALAHALTGSYACHSRMAELRKMGYDVRCRIVHIGKTKFGEYSLVQASEQIP